jgi:hypothetical protein
MNGPRSSSPLLTSTFLRRGIANGVADQVADQDAQRFFLAVTTASPAVGVAPRSIRRASASGRCSAMTLCCQFASCHRYQRSLATARFLAGQGQELLHRMGGALQPALEFGEGVGT